MGRAARGGDEDELASVVHHNIRALLAMSAESERKAPRSVRLADAVTRFTGSMGSVVLHLLLFGGWIIVNSGIVPGIDPFDPFPFVMLAMFASVEAIFLTTFVLVSQNRMAELSDRRAKLDLQINLLAEHEVTRLIEMVDAIAERVGASKHDVEDLKRDVRPEQVLDALEKAEAEATMKGAHGQSDEAGVTPRGEPGGPHPSRP